MSGKAAFESNTARFSFDFGVSDRQPHSGYYHSHQAAEFLYVHEGSGRVVVRDKVYEIKPGAFFYFQPYQLHRVTADARTDRPYVRSILHFMPAMAEEPLRAYPRLHAFFVRMWRNRLPEQGYHLEEERPVLESLLRFYAEGAADARDPASQEEEAALFLTQLLRILRKLHERWDDARDEGPAVGTRHSDAIMRWIDARFADRFSLEELAAAMHLSKYHLSRLFRFETGMSITDYATARRLKEACRLLRATALPIDAVGMEVGIGSPSYFSQLFRRHIGMTPHAYRKRG